MTGGYAFEGTFGVRKTNHSSKSENSLHCRSTESRRAPATSSSREMILLHIVSVARKWVRSLGNAIGL